MYLYCLQMLQTTLSDSCALVTMMKHFFVFAEGDFRQLCISDNDKACSEHFFDFADSDFRLLCISDNDEAGSEHFFVFADSDFRQLRISDNDEGRSENSLYLLTPI